MSSAAVLATLKAPIKALIQEAQPIALEPGTIVFGVPPRRFDATNERFRKEASAIKREVHMRGYHPEEFVLFAIGAVLFLVAYGRAVARMREVIMEPKAFTAADIAFHHGLALGAIEDRPLKIHDERALWSAAIDGSDRFAAAALDRDPRGE